MTSRDHAFGLRVYVTQIDGAICFENRREAVEWVENIVQWGSGPILWTGEWTDRGWQLQFAIAGMAIDRLAMNARNRRSGLPTYQWNDSEHPLMPRARQAR